MAQEARDEEEGLSGNTAISSPVQNILDYESAPSESHLNSASEDEPNNAGPLPIWLVESSKAFKWGWVPLPLRKAGRATVKWLRGPDPPQDLRFTPIFPHIQEAPIRFLHRFFPKKKHRIALLLFAYFSWFLSFSLVLRHSVSSGHIEGYGRPQAISCSASYWSNGNRCGLNGDDCRPFNASTFTFRCPAFCSASKLLNPHTVGNQTINYQPLIVGGPPPGSSNGVYRADSYVCQAAMHAGIISDSGGCGVLELSGASRFFYSSSAHGFTSTSFLSTFPKSFRFLQLPNSQSDCPRDLRWPLFAITITTIALISIFTTSPAVFFFSTFFLLMMQIGLVSDPPNISEIRELLSLLFARLLPASFVAYALYLYCALPLLQPLSSPPIYQLSKTVLYLAPACIGALNNYTFARWIPLQRLTPHDIRNQPGAPLALMIVLSIVILIVLFQMWYIRIGGLFFRFLKIYAILATGVIILLVLPGFRLRIHHYILAMLLMPGTGFPTRPSLLLQGLLLGLFVNGVARWGFASIVQTPDALGELPSPGGQDGWWGATSPNITNSSVTISLPSPPEYHGNGNITFNLWEHKRMAELQVDGVSVLVNDVERWRGYLDENKKGKFTWHRHGHQGLDISAQDTEDDDEVPEDLFFRFAFLRGSTAGKYGGVGVWNSGGTWVSPPPPRT